MRILFFLIIFLMMPLVTATLECGRFTDVGDIPCNIISSYNNTGNCYVNGSVYNESGIIISNLTWANYTPNCYTVFNISELGTYQYTGVEEGIITIEGDKKMIAAIIILIPLIMAIVFMIGSFALSDSHAILRIYLFLMSLITFFVALHFGLISVIKFMNFPELQELIGTTTYWYAILFGGVMLYLIIYMIYIFIKTTAQTKQEKIEY